MRNWRRSNSFRTWPIVVLAACILGSVALVPETAQAAPITKTITGVVQGGGTFTGTFTLQSFAVQANKIVAIGNLVGVLKNASGILKGNVNQLIALPVLFGRHTCKILELTLGPLDLELLGLNVHLDVVHLTITAEQGSGNLLGNLLCAVASLLDSNGPLDAIKDLLNNILALL